MNAEFVSESQSDGKLQKLARFAEDYWTDFLLVLLPIVSAFACFAFTEEFQKYWTGLNQLDPQYLYRARFVWLTIVGISIIGLGLTVWRHVVKQMCLSSLRNENLSMKADREAVINDMKAAIAGYLWGIAEDLDFVHTDRLTLYCHDTEISSFLNIFRICRNPDWQGHNRTSYPDNQGFISKAWRDGRVFVDDLPDPVRQKKKYIRETSVFNFPESLHGILRMKSRLYAGWQITDGNGHRSLAVLMIESTEPSRWSEEELDKYFGSQQGKLHSIFERVHKHLPELSDAAKRGF